MRFEAPVYQGFQMKLPEVGWVKFVNGVYETTDEKTVKAIREHEKYGVYFKEVGPRTWALEVLKTKEVKKSGKEEVSKAKGQEEVAAVPNLSKLFK